MENIDKIKEKFKLDDKIFMNMLSEVKVKFIKNKFLVDKNECLEWLKCNKHLYVDRDDTYFIKSRL